MIDQQPLVGIIMGSTLDWETMRYAAEILAELRVFHECKVVSAHRTLAWMVEYAMTAEVVLVVSNRKDAYGLVRAREPGIPTLYRPCVGRRLCLE